MQEIVKTASSERERYTTLTDEEVQKAHERVVNHLRAQVPVELR